MAAKTEGARAQTSATVETTAGDPRVIRIVCVECGAEVDRVGYDAAEQTPAAVSTLMSTLGVDEKAARAIIGEHNPDQLRTQQEAAEELAGDIVACDVPDRDVSTYGCPNGHDEGLKVSA